MLKYREFLDLTDEEIKFILTELFEPIAIKEINRNKRTNEFIVTVVTSGWLVKGEEVDIEDEITLAMPSFNGCGLDVPFSFPEENEWKWKQFLLAKGCSYLLKDNPYLS